MGVGDKIVEGAFRAVLICSAIYFGAKYAPYVLDLADKVKAKVFPQLCNKTPLNQALDLYRADPPQSLMQSNPRLYNAITIDNFVNNSRKIVGVEGKIEEK